MKQSVEINWYEPFSSGNNTGKFKVTPTMFKLEHYGGSGYAGVKEDGEFTVKVGTLEYKYTCLSEARKFYNSIKYIEKALWLTSGTPELLECHTVNSEGGNR